MNTLNSVYNRLIKAGMNGEISTEIKDLDEDIDFDPHQLDCLLNPQKHPPVIKLGKCSCLDEKKAECMKACEFDAIYKDENGNWIQKDKLFSLAFQFFLSWLCNLNIFDLFSLR